MGNTVIGIFGSRNAGKSSLLNSLSGQEVAIVSSVPGTTTDPVRKRIELPGIGICTVIDTAGLDDDGGDLGRERVARSLQAAEQVDLGIIVLSGNDFPPAAEDLTALLRRREVPFLLVHNREDEAPMTEGFAGQMRRRFGSEPMRYSCLKATTEDRDALTAAIRARLAEGLMRPRPMFEGLAAPGRRILLVCPIDSEAPEGRLILPQVMAIRSILDYGAVAQVLQPEQLEAEIRSDAGKISLVVTDSQVFARVAAIVPESIPLTSFSMLLARSTGSLEIFREGIRAVESLREGDTVLMLESCSHHANCEDIGRVKIPALLQKHCGCHLNFEMVSGLDPIEGDLSHYALAVQCGGCMVTPRQLRNRIAYVAESGMKLVNYGMLIAYLSGIYDRAIKPLI